jgi:hypothetical protein
MKKIELPQSVIKNKEKMIVVGVSIAALILLLVFVFKPEDSSEQRANPNDVVVLSNTGEASVINTSVPEFKIKRDSSNLVDKYASYKQDSINQEKILENNKMALSGNSRLTSGSSYNSGYSENLKERESSYADSPSDRLAAYMNESASRAKKNVSSIREEEEEEEERPIRKKKKKNSTKSVYGDYSFWDNTPAEQSQGQRQVSVSTTNSSAEQGQNVVEQGYGQSSQQVVSERTNRNNYTSRSRGKKVRFEDLDPAEQKQVLREIGKPYYEENTEILAEIVTVGTVQQGESVKLMTTEEAIWNLHRIPRGTVITGVVSFSGNRCNIELSSFVLKGRKIVDGNFEVYSMNGARGLEVNGFNATEEVEEEGLSEGLSSLGRVGRAAGAVTNALRSKNKRSITISNRTPCLLRVKNNS